MRKISYDRTSQQSSTLLIGCSPMYMSIALKEYQKLHLMAVLYPRLEGDGTFEWP